MNRNLKYIFSGTATGLANGFFGAGGGLLLVPLLTHWVKLKRKNAFASSVAVIVPISAVSAVIYLLNNNLNILKSLPYLIGGVIGGVLSGRLFKNVPSKWLKYAFGALCVYGGIRAVLLI